MVVRVKNWGLQRVESGKNIEVGCVCNQFSVCFSQVVCDTRGSDVPTTHPEERWIAPLSVGPGQRPRLVPNRNVGDTAQPLFRGRVIRVAAQLACVRQVYTLCG